MTATTTSARSDLSELGRSEAALRTFLHGLPGVDQVGAEQRAATLGTRSIKTTAKAVGDRPGDPDGRPDHAGGRGHARQGAGAVRQGAAPRPGRPGGARRSRRSASTRRWSPARGRGAARHAACTLASVATAFPSGQAPLAVKLADTRGGRRRRRRRDRHGDQPGRVPGRPLRARSTRRSCAVQGGLRRRASQGDPGDRRAGHLRQRPPRLLAGHAGRRRLHQDLDRQGRRPRRRRR